MKREFCVGSSSFSNLVACDEQGNFKYYFVDKTLFIREFLENKSHVTILPRPRRFGKSTNMDMLKLFFSINKANENRKLFGNLKIADAERVEHKNYLDFQGRYPVIYLNFKSLQQNSFDDILFALKHIMAKVYEEFAYLLNSTLLSTAKKERIQQFIDSSIADVRQYQYALSSLMEYLFLHHGKKVMVLIDEYDVPFQSAVHLCGSDLDNRSGMLEATKTFFGQFLGAALKDNHEVLEKCLMTGVVRIAGAGVFSGLNNMEIYTILDEPFKDSFGFTDEEVATLLMQADREDQKSAYAKWYNGYQFGNQTVIYNPWSVICSLKENEFRAYWLGTSDNELIRNILLKSSDMKDRREINSTIAVLLGKGQVVTKKMGSDLIFDERAGTLENLWTLLLSAGYLKSQKTERIADTNMMNCSLAIPNFEVGSMYKSIFNDWLEREVREITSDPALFIDSLLKGDVEDFCKQLQAIFEKIISARDASRPSDEEEAMRYEAFYHGFMVGLLALSLQEGKHNVSLRSNRESGNGYYDLVLEPKVLHDATYWQGVVFEFKRVKSENKLEDGAVSALKQIKDNKYATDMIDRSVKQVVCIGMAFYRKKLAAKYEYYAGQSKTSSDSLAYVPARRSDVVTVPASTSSEANLSSTTCGLATKKPPARIQEDVAERQSSPGVSGGSLTPDPLKIEAIIPRPKSARDQDDLDDFQPAMRKKARPGK